MGSLIRPLLSSAGTVVALCVFAATASAAPGTILFSDDFEDGDLNPWSTTDGSISGVLSGVDVSNSGNNGGYTSNDVVTVTSPTINAAVPGAELSIWVRRGSDAFSEDTDGGENFVLQYQRADSSWGTLNVYLGSGTNGQIYNDTFALPSDALHGSLVLRVQQTAGSGFDYDYWHFDDVVLTETVAAPPFGVGDCEDFESGLFPTWSITSAGGSAGTNADTAQSPTNSLYTSEGVVEVVSANIDTTDPAFSTLSMWIRRGGDSFSEDPDPGEDFVVEYFNDGGSWIQLELFAGSGSNGEILVRDYAMPADARHAGFRIRFRQTAGSGTGWDYWHVDDVCLNTQLLPDITVNKTQQVFSDPINGTTNPFAIPGALVDYNVKVVNFGAGVVDADTLVITDVLPSNVALFVDTSGGDPIVFVDGPTASGLSYLYASDVTFDDQPGGTGPFTYIPTPDAQGFDAAVTAIRVTFSGVMNAAGGGGNPEFDLRFRLRVE